MFGRATDRLHSVPTPALRHSPVISYRSIKRLLGETSLERKCRFLFGAGLLFLISGSFYLYWMLTKDLVGTQAVSMARDLVPKVFNTEHLVARVRSEGEKPGDNTEARNQEQVTPDIFDAYSAVKQGRTGIHGWSLGQATTELDFKALDSLQQQNRKTKSANKEDGDTSVEPVPFFKELGRDAEGRETLDYYEMMLATKDCISCHRDVAIVNGDDPMEIVEGSELGLVRVTLLMEDTQNSFKKITLLLLALAILTAFLAMLGSYAIVRYVIVKPVLHLKDVSEEISRGNLELRADINTGDEFEQLSHAFNRMLRHMMTVNDELRTLNADLDVKFDQLAQVNLRLYETNKMKDEFLATISHELRTPLNSIIGFSDVLLSGGSLSEKERRYVTTIQTSGESLRVLIDDLLDLAKIESGKMDIQAGEFAIEELIERQTTNVQPLAEKKNIELKWDVTPGVPRMLQDFGKLSQILNNLLSNAIKFTPEGGRVRVTARQSDRTNIEMLVEDSGIGIPLNEQEQVFEKFRQGTTTPGKRDHTTREYEGTGLGLSIVRELSHLLGGEVSLTSEFGKGSTFTVRIPVEVKIELNEPEVDLEADTQIDTPTNIIANPPQTRG
jgi:signal transduction histidine kinase